MPLPPCGRSVSKHAYYIKCDLCLLIDPSYTFKSALNASAPTSPADIAPVNGANSGCADVITPSNGIAD